MLANYHTHSVFSDGKNTPEEIVLKAIEKGFDALGFSDHGYTAYDFSYCMQDTAGYIKEIKRLKEKYKSRIQIYLGVEEDCGECVDRSLFEYLIGSAHYIFAGGRARSLDSDLDSYLSECLGAFDGDALKLAEKYYSEFSGYLLRRKPDIVGHFDLLTKFDELDGNRLLGNEQYHRLAEKYLAYAVKSESIFEINAGAMSRGVRTSPYPHERLLYALKKEGGKVMLGSDSHAADTLDFAFAEMRKLIREVGFGHLYVLYDGSWKKEYL